MRYRLTTPSITPKKEPGLSIKRTIFFKSIDKNKDKDEDGHVTITGNVIFVKCFTRGDDFQRHKNTS